MPASAPGEPEREPDVPGRAPPSARRRRRPLAAADRVVGGDLDENDPHPVGILGPHLGQPPRLSVFGSHSTRTPAAASRSCTAWTSRTWTHSAADRPAGPRRARTPPAARRRGRTPAPGCPGRRTPGRSPGRARRGRNGGFAQGRWVQQDPAAQNLHAAILAARGRPGAHRPRRRHLAAKRCAARGRPGPRRAVPAPPAVT